uniref:Uncharacterized protein n=1 Tax=Brassica oleracea TaxID=3712 RepID=A0A3P6B3R9_BRAOL|nr:unnamed protein product [Brassica oleracea]
MLETQGQMYLTVQRNGGRIPKKTMLKELKTKLMKERAKQLIKLTRPKSRLKAQPTKQRRRLKTTRN